MKRIPWLSMAILATMIVYSCQKEIEVTIDADAYILTASIDPDIPTRTAFGSYFGGETAILWTAKDQIGVYADEAVEPALFKLVSGEGSTVAEFSGPVPGTCFRAIYPWSIAGNADETGFSLILPEEQEYTPGTVASGYLPMAAASTTDKLSFKNLCAILKVSITGHQVVTNLEFFPNDPNTTVSGPATTSFSNGVPQLTMSPEGNNKVVLKTSGVLLNRDTATDFYIVLPPQTYKGGFTIRIHTSGGYMDKVYQGDFTMERSSIHKATPFELKLDQGIEPSLSLKGKGTSEDPFLIGSLSDLLLMQASVNNPGGTITDADGMVVSAQSACYRMTADIDLSPVCGASSGNSWTPIGNASANENLCFTGRFDGDGHTVSNLYIHQDLDLQGLFGQSVAHGWVQGIISNLRVSGSVSGVANVGMIVGKGGIVSGCTTEGEVMSDYDFSGGIAGDLIKADHCINRASVRKTRGGTYNIGGIAGIIRDICNDCINEGDITSVEGHRIGGIAGYAYADIYNCTNTGTVVGGQQCGGIAGYFHGTLENCFNGGNVSSGYGYCGGIVGVLDFNSHIRNCVNTAQVREESWGQDAGGVCGYVDKDTSIDYGYWSGIVRGVVTFVSESSSPCIMYRISQWQGEQSDTVYYSTAEGFPCTSLIDALNAWVYENRNENKEYCRWEYDAERETGMLSGKPAVNPAGEDGFLILLPSSQETGVNGGTLPVRVASSSAYSVTSAPEWMHLGEGTAYESIPNYWMHSLTVDIQTGSRRTGTIVLTNADGKSASLAVTQYGRDEFDWGQDFYHQSLFFVYSNAGSSSYEEAFLEALKVYPDRIVHAALFRNGNLSCPQSKSMFEKNGINGWPILLLDNIARIANGNLQVTLEGILASYRDIESRKSLSYVQIQTELSGRSVKVDLHGYFKKAGDYKVQVMLLEDGIFDNGETFNDIVRVVMTSETGDPFTIQEDHSERTFTYNATVPQGYDLSKMHVLVFIQAPVFDTTFMVDNAFTAPIPTP